MAMSATQLRVGMIVEHQNEPHRVMDLIHVTPGNKRGFVQTKLRNLRSGLQTGHKFRSDDQVSRIVLDQQEMEFLYQSGAEYHFMNVEKSPGRLRALPGPQPEIAGGVPRWGADHRVSTEDRRPPGRRHAPGHEDGQRHGRDETGHAGDGPG